MANNFLKLNGEKPDIVGGFFSPSKHTTSSSNHLGVLSQYGEMLNGGAWSLRLQILVSFLIETSDLTSFCQVVSYHCAIQITPLKPRYETSRHASVSVIRYTQDSIGQQYHSSIMDNVT